MKVLVTGANGFIGSEIVRECIDAAFELIQIVKNPRENTFENNRFDYSGEVIAVDITNVENLKKLEKLSKVDVIIHAAGLAHQFGDTKKEEFDLVNVQGAQNICELSVKLKVRHFILISSTAVYGAYENENKSGEQNERQKILDENSKVKPQTLYAKSKLEAEQVCAEICGENKIPLTILRLAPVIGEENVGNAARLISAIDRKRFVWIGNGENFKSLIYKNDVARACVKLIKEKNGETEIFNLSGVPVRMKDFVGEISECLQTSVPLLKIPAVFTDFIFGVNNKIFRIKKISKIQQTIEKWLAEDVYESRKIKDKYNFAPKFTVAEGVRKQVAWYILEKDRNL